MNQKDAKQIIQEFMKSKNFVDNFGGGLVDEALHRAITALEMEDESMIGRLPSPRLRHLYKKE